MKKKSKTKTKDKTKLGYFKDFERLHSAGGWSTCRVRVGKEDLKTGDILELHVYDMDKDANICVKCPGWLSNLILYENERASCVLREKIHKTLTDSALNRLF